VADVLFGDVAPGGKLPFSWPRTVGQVPVIYSHTISHDPGNQGRRYWDEASTPLYPFGYGLSYGRFEYSDLTLDRDQIEAGQTVTVSVTVTNAGRRAGDEVAQLYLRQRYGSASRPSRELKGFQRVTLAAGESRTLRFPLGPGELRYWNAAARDWVIDTTTIDVFAGGDSTAELTTSFTVGWAAPASCRPDELQRGVDRRDIVWVAGDDGMSPVAGADGHAHVHYVRRAGGRAPGTHPKRHHGVQRDDRRV
jgi:beta-glucosidase